MIRSTIRRLGKFAGAVIDVLERAGGTATVQELADALQKTRTRDLRRRTIARLEAAGEVECSEAGDTVALTERWLDALNREREIVAARRDMARYAREREAYRERDRIEPDPASVPERPPDGEIRELEQVEASDTELVEALAAYLKRNPRRCGERPSWLAVALWADEYLPGKPTPAAVEVALGSPELRLAKLVA